MDDPAETPRPSGAWERVLAVLLTGDTRLAEALVGIEYALLGAGTAMGGAPSWPEASQDQVVVLAALAGAYGVAQTFAALLCNRRARQFMHLAGAFASVVLMLVAVQSSNLASALVYGALGTFCVFLAARAHWDEARAAAAAKAEREREWRPR